MMRKINNEAEALKVDPYECDRDESPVILSNKIVTVKKERPCDYCKCTIPQGERARVMSYLYDDQMHRQTFCADCLNLMVASEDDQNGDISMALEDRSRKGWEEYEAKKARGEE